ncbi:hypothetical protein MP228_011754 [Amoeboaphelidium protococcarum]|nr:hypothetical protein MP228_011754 [Amoeboaphelidium protococcarum]
MSNLTELQYGDKSLLRYSRFVYTVHIQVPGGGAIQSYGSSRFRLSEDENTYSGQSLYQLLERNSPPSRWRDSVIRQSTQAQKDLCFEFSHAEWLQTRPDVPFALMRGNYGGYVDNIAESYLRHCWVQVMMNVQSRIKEYLVNELPKVPAFRILKTRQSGEYLD